MNKLIMAQVRMLVMETIHDAKEPLEVKWFNESYVKIPIWKD